MSYFKKVYQLYQYFLPRVYNVVVLIVLVLHYIVILVVPVRQHINMIVMLYEILPVVHVVPNRNNTIHKFHNT